MITWTSLLGVRTPLHHGDPTAELATLRRGATLSALPHFAAVSLQGASAREWCGQLVPGGGRLRPGEARHSVLLDEDGVVLADAWVLDDRDQLLVITDGIDSAGLLAHVQAGCPCDTTVVPLADTHAVHSLDGPFSWEVLARFDSPGVIGLPPMTFYRTVDDALCVRCSRTGEYAYLLIVPIAEEQALLDGLRQAGEPVALGVAGVAALATAALENFVFWPHEEGQHGLTPLELQLQWRLPPDGDHRGAAALKARRASGWTERCTTFWAPSAAPGQVVSVDGRPIGRVLRSEGWQHGTGVIGLALLDLAHAHPGFSYDLPDGPLVTVTPPLLVNRSLLVRPQRHAWEDAPGLPLAVPRDLG